jgi:hypothetical protein
MWIFLFSTRGLPAVTELQPCRVFVKRAVLLPTVRLTCHYSRHEAEPHSCSLLPQSPSLLLSPPLRCVVFCDWFHKTPFNKSVRRFMVTFRKNTPFVSPTTKAYSMAVSVFYEDPFNSVASTHTECLMADSLNHRPS